MLKRFINRFKAKQIILFAINILLIVLFIVLQIISSSITGSLESQKLADRWSVDNSFTQISVFLSENTALSVDDINSVRYSVDSALETDSMAAENENARLWVDAYSTEDSVSVSRESKSIDSVVTAVGGDFFLFQPLELISGTYFGDSSADDLVIIDENLAWQLFGSSEVTGMELEIGDRPYLISGVSKCEDDFASKTAYGESPHIYMSYSAYEGISGTSSSGAENEEASATSESGDSGTLGITVYQALIPNPVKNYGLNTLTGVFEGYTDKSFSIIENSSRYSVSNLFELIKSFGSRSMNQKGISYPYWEYAARIVEDYAALFFVISILLVIFPIISLLVLLIKLWRSRKWRAGDIRYVAERIIESSRGKQKVLKTRKKAEHSSQNAGKDDVADEISDIVKSFMDDDK